MPTARGSWRRDWRRVGKAEVDVEVDADMVEEKLEEEERRRRRRRRRRRKAERTALIKSNNPHLAGGEKHCNYRDSNLEFALPFAIGVSTGTVVCQPKGDLALQSQRRPMQITYCYVYIYIYTIYSCIPR